MKDLIKGAKLSDVLWWIFLILIFVIYPIQQIYFGELKYLDEVVEDKPFWLYLDVIFVWDWFIIVGFATLSLMGLILAKIGQWVYDIKKGN